MDRNDKTHDTPGFDAESDASVDKDTHQRPASPAVMQAVTSPKSPLATTSPNLGNSTLGKRKATGSPPSVRSLPTGTVNVFQQTSVEPADGHERSTKKHKVKDETSGHESPKFSQSGLFVERDATPTVDVAAFLTTSIANLTQELRLIELEQIQLSTAPPQLKDGTAVLRVGPYDTTIEKKASSLSIDRPNFAAARRIEEKIVDFVLTVVKRLDDTYGELDDSEVSVFCRKLKAVVAPQKYMQHARSVSLISDPGVGKSLLINNLLNIPGAAISKSSRMSTTNVRHEYIDAGSQLRSPVVAVVHPSAESNISSKIRSRVAKVLEFREYEQRSPGDAFYKAEHDLLKQEKTAALEYLASLVVSPDADSSFRDVFSLERYITKNSDAKERDTVQHLSDCVQTYQVSRAGTTGQITFEASSVSALQSKDEIREFAGYSKDPSDPRTLWRVIEKISMYVPALVLENGLCLNDVPGIDLDTDQSRNETGEEAYKACDVIVLLKPYERSSNSRTLMNTFRNCIRDGKDVVLVVTHLDSFDNSDELADEEETDGKLRKLIKAEQEAEEQAEQDDEYDTEELAKIAKLKYLRRIAIRAESISREMERVFRGLQLEWNGCEGAKLRVFPLLNKDHAHYVKGYHTNRLPEDRPRVPIEQTGLIPLRTFLRGIPAEMMLRTLDLSKTDLERLLVAIELYCVSSKLERKQEIEHLVTDPKEDCAFEIDGVVKVLKNETGAILEKVISDRKLIWRDQGERLSKEWGGKHHTNYLAFCKKQGNHRTGVDKENWNDAVQSIMLADLVAGFKLVYDMVKRNESEFLEVVTGLMKNIAEDLKSMRVNTMVHPACLY
jgi:hypothetical protein